MNINFKKISFITFIKFLPSIQSYLLQAFVVALPNLCAKFGISYLYQYPGIWQNSDWGIPKGLIFGQFLFVLSKRNYHNSRTSDDIDMKLRPVTKSGKKSKTTSNKFDDVGKLWCRCLFSNLRPIWSNLEGGFVKHSL